MHDITSTVNINKIYDSIRDKPFQHQTGADLIISMNIRYNFYLHQPTSLSTKQTNLVLWNLAYIINLC